jgi:hypothetical protein
MKDTCMPCILKRMTWKKMRIVYSVCCSCSGGVSIEASNTLMDRMMGIQWKMRNYDFFVGTSDSRSVLSWKL